MADDKIVTKKTAAKPSVSKKAPVKAAAVTKKAAVKPAAPAKKTPIRAATPPPPPRAPAAPLATPAPSLAAKKVAVRKTTAKKAAPKPAQQPPLAEKPVSIQHLSQVTPEGRLDMIREAAYFKAEKRNFAPGHDEADWAEAEREIDDLLARARSIFKR